MTYRVEAGCQWKDFTLYGDAVGTVVDSAALVTGDGVPLPPDVVAVFVEAGCLVPVGGDG